MTSGGILHCPSPISCIHSAPQSPWVLGSGFPSHMGPCRLWSYPQGLAGLGLLLSQFQKPAVSNLLFSFLQLLMEVPSRCKAQFSYRLPAILQAGAILVILWKPPFLRRFCFKDGSILKTGLLKNGASLKKTDFQRIVKIAPACILAQGSLCMKVEPCIGWVLQASWGRVCVSGPRSASCSKFPRTSRLCSHLTFSWVAGWQAGPRSAGTLRVRKQSMWCLEMQEALENPAQASQSLP